MSVPYQNTVNITCSVICSPCSNFECDQSHNATAGIPWSYILRAPAGHVLHADNRCVDCRTLPLWKQFDNGINQYALYSEEDDQHVDDMMMTMATQFPVTADTMHRRATSLKLMFDYEDGSKGFFKSKRSVM